MRKYKFACMCMYILTYKLIVAAQSAGAVVYTNSKTPSTSVLDMTLNYLMVGFLVMLELWGMWSTPLLPSLPGRLWPGVVAPDKGPIYGLIRTKPCFLHYSDFCI